MGRTTATLSLLFFNLRITGSRHTLPQCPTRFALENVFLHEILPISETRASGFFLERTNGRVNSIFCMIQNGFIV